MISTESQKGQLGYTTVCLKSPKKDGKRKSASEKPLCGKTDTCDVTCDAVIITRDLAVTKNHTSQKSQGHKTVNRAQRQSEELNFGGRNWVTV